MTPTQFEDAVLALFTTYWSNTETAIISFPNQKFDKPDPATSKSFIVCEIAHTHGSQISLGAIGGRQFRKYGILGFGVWVPRDSGSSEINRICGLIERIYMDHDIGANMMNPRMRRFGDGSDGWYVQSLFIDFSFDDIK